MIDDYNNFMNKVDQADQLQSQYHCDHWTRTRKWWWAIWLWGVQVLQVNSYILHKHAHLYMWKTKASRLLTHNEFQKMVALHWINPELYPIASDSEMDRVKRCRLNANTSTIIEF
jgi:hypothetical protein